MGTVWGERKALEVARKNIVCECPLCAAPCRGGRDIVAVYGVILLPGFGHSAWYVPVVVLAFMAGGIHRTRPGWDTAMVGGRYLTWPTKERGGECDPLEVPSREDGNMLDQRRLWCRRHL